MSRTLLTVARLDECDALIGTALTNGWSVLNTALIADIPAVLARTKVDLIVMSQSCGGADWASTSSDIWAADQRTPIILCDSRLDMESLDHFFGARRRSEAERRSGHAETSFCRLSLSPSLSLIENSPGRNAGIDRALALIEDHYAERLTLADAAAAACYSRCHFSKVFKDQVGIAFSAYLSLVRVRHAAELLTDTSQSVTDIAFRVGFNDLSNFERVFRNTLHLSPSQFRHQIKDQNRSKYLRISP